MKELDKHTVAELREILKPYGTPYRLQLNRRELLDRVRLIRWNEERFGTPSPTPEQMWKDREGR